DEARTGYYNVGSLTSCSDPSGSATYNYDAVGNLVQNTKVISGNSYTFTRGFDAAGRLQWVTLPDGDTVGTSSSPLLYDTAGRVKTIPNIVTTALSDARGQLTSQTNVNGTVTTRTFSTQRFWMTGIATTKGATTIQNLNLSPSDSPRDAEGKITKVTSS